MAYQTQFPKDNYHAVDALHGRTVTSFQSHMTQDRPWTAKDWENADKLNPLPNDHKGRKDHSNEQVRHELYLLGPGEKKVTEEIDTSKSSHNLVFFVLSSRSVRDMVGSEADLDFPNLLLYLYRLLCWLHR